MLIDLYAKVLTDSLNALVCMGASEDGQLAPCNQHCNRTHAGACLRRLLPRLVMGLESLADLLERALVCAAQPHINADQAENQQDPIDTSSRIQT